jgi:hypothetical protein
MVPLITLFALLTSSVNIRRVDSETVYDAFVSGKIGVIMGIRSMLEAFQMNLCRLIGIGGYSSVDSVNEVNVIGLGHFQEE